MEGGNSWKLLLLLLSRADAVSLRSNRAEAEQPSLLPRVPPAAAPAGPAPAPAMAPGPAPWVDEWNLEMNRPKITDEQCKELEQAILVKPAAECKASTFAFKWDGCVCTMALPNNINPVPDITFNPFPEAVEPDSAVPTLPPLQMIPPPTNPAQAYVPPPMKPQCPFSKSCVAPSEDATACVGMESWGFAEVHMGRYSPASGYLNTITCSYMMKPKGNFSVPIAVTPEPAASVEFAAVQHERLELQCASKPINGTLGQLCSSALGKKLGASCETTWADFFGGRCEEAPPPRGFALHSKFKDLCPGECVKTNK